MPKTALAWVVLALGAAAAWGAARSGAVLPLVWMVLLLALLALQPGERRLADPGWLALALAALALATATSLDRELAVHLALVLGAAVLLFGLARRAPLDDARLAVLAVAVAATATVAVLQAAGGLERASLEVISLPAALQEVAAARLATGRAFGTAALPGHFAVLLLMAAPLLSARALAASGRARVGWLAALALVPVGVALTRSVVAVGVAAVLIAIAGLAGRRAPKAALAAVALLAVTGAAVVLARGDLGRLEPVALRWINWRAAAGALAERPWLGAGLGGVGQASLAGPLGAVNNSPYAHNTVLQMAAETGVAGAGVLLAGLAALVRLLRRGLVAERPLALAVLVVPLHNLVDFSAYSPEVVLPWAVLAGTLAARVLPSPRRAVPGPLLLAVLGTGTVAAALDWRAEVELERALAAGPDERAGMALAAARWSPWALTPLLAASADLGAAAPAERDAVERELGRRWWVRPRSPAWAEGRALALLSLGRPAEARVWAREARRRAPWQARLVALEESCAPTP